MVFFNSTPSLVMVLDKETLNPIVTVDPVKCSSVKVFYFFFLGFYSFAQSRCDKINVFFILLHNLAGNGTGLLVFLKHDFSVFYIDNIS